MPIKPELRYFYPIDWPQISRWVRFVRAGGRCEACGRPHGATVCHLGDGRWWDEMLKVWRDGRGRRIPSPRLRRPAGRPGSCWRQRISTTTRHIAAVSTAMSGRSASGATCSTIVLSTGGGSG